MVLSGSSQCGDSAVGIIITMGAKEPRSQGDRRRDPASPMVVAINGGTPIAGWFGFHGESMNKWMMRFWGTPMTQETSTCFFAIMKMSGFSSFRRPITEKLGTCVAVLCCRVRIEVNSQSLTPWNSLGIFDLVLSMVSFFGQGSNSRVLNDAHVS